MSVTIIIDIFNVLNIFIDEVSISTKNSAVSKSHTLSVKISAMSKFRAIPLYGIVYLNKRYAQSSLGSGMAWESVQS